MQTKLNFIKQPKINPLWNMFRCMWEKEMILGEKKERKVVGTYPNYKN